MIAFLNRICLLVLLFTALGCRDHKSISSKVDFTTFEEVEKTTMFENLSFEDSVDYYEARYGLCDNLEFNVLYSNGLKCDSTGDNDSCLSVLDSIKPYPNGFHRNCSPACCHHYLVTEWNGEVKTHSNISQLKSLLGKINTSNEALLWVFAYGYYFLPNDRYNGSVKAEKDGFKVIALKLMNECAPYQIDRFLLNVLENGTINIEEQETHDKNNDPCP